MPVKATKSLKRSAVPGKRYPLNMRTTFDMRHNLEVAAAKSGRSLAQEAEYRLQRSFDSQTLLGEALSYFQCATPTPERIKT